MTASTPTCGRSPQIGVRMMPASAASAAPKPKTSMRKRGEVDAERAHHLAVMRAGLDDRAIGRLFEEQPDQRRSRAAPNSAAKKR